MRTKPIQIFAAAVFCACLAISQKSLADALDNWTTNQVSTNYFRLENVAYGNGRYVAFGEFSDWGMVTTSEDGKNWTLRADGLNGSGPGSGAGLSYSISFAYTGNRFFTFGGFSYSAVSSNGIHWDTFGYFTNGVGMMAGVAYGATRYVAVGAANPNTATNVWTSNNGINWTPRRAGTPTNVTLIDIAYGAGTFVAIPGSATDIYGLPDPGHIYTSPNGINSWTQRNILGGSRVSFCNGIFIVPYVGGTNLISSNGIDWSAVNTGITNALSKVHYYGSLFMARAGTRLATSVNGTNWTVYPQVLPGVVNDHNIASDGARLVTVGGTSVNLFNHTGLAFLSDPLVAIRTTNTIPPQLVISGLVGRSYRIEYSDGILGTNTWQALATVQLPSTPYSLVDATATNSPQRFYRGVLLP